MDSFLPCVFHVKDTKWSLVIHIGVYLVTLVGRFPFARFTFARFTYAEPIIEVSLEDVVNLEQVKF